MDTTNSSADNRVEIDGEVAEFRRQFETDASTGSGQPEKASGQPEKKSAAAPWAVTNWTFVVVLLSYFVAGLAPFEFAKPFGERNRAQSAVDGVLTFHEPGVAVPQAVPTTVQAGVLEGSFSTRFRSRHTGPATGDVRSLFTVASMNSPWSFQIGEWWGDLVIMQTTRTGTQAKRCIVPGVFESEQWQEFEVSVDPAAITVCYGGETFEFGPHVGAANERLQFILGNSLSATRPWRGEIAVAELTAGGSSFDLLDPAVLTIPNGIQRIKKLKELDPRNYALASMVSRDALLNFLCFIPIGFVLVMSLSRGRSVVAALAIGAAASLAVEFAQLFVAGRFPSGLDFVMNCCGMLVGVLIVPRWFATLPSDAATFKGEQLPADASADPNWGLNPGQPSSPAAPVPQPQTETAGHGTVVTGR